MATYNETVTETPSLSETVSLLFDAMASATDSAAITEVLTTEEIYLLAEALLVSEVLSIVLFMPPLIEALDLSETILDSGVTALQEILMLAEVVMPNGSFSTGLTETIALEDVIRVLAEELVSDTLSATGSITTVYDIVSSLADQLSMDTSVTVGQVLGLTVSSTIALTDAVTTALLEVVAEALGLSESAAGMISGVGVAADGLVLSEALVPTTLAVVVNSETLDLADTSLGAAQLAALISDELAFVAAFYDGDEVFTSYVMNTRNNGVTTYDGYAFNSFADMDGTILAAGADGLVTLGGVLDDTSTIDWSLKTGKLNVGTGKQTRVEKAFIACEADGKLILKVTDGAEYVRWYKSRTPRGGSNMAVSTLGRGVNSLYWQFELVPDGDVDFKLDSIELIPVALKRR